MRYIIIFIISFSLLACEPPCNEPLFLYEPTEFDGNCFIRVQNLMTKNHFDKVEKVLTFYNIEHERTSITSIELKVGLLPELVYNYGSKAEDGGWLQQRELQ